MRLSFIDKRGNELEQEDGVQCVRQFDELWDWQIRLDEPWDGGVSLLGPLSLPLIRQENGDWRLPDDKPSKKSREKYRTILAASAGTVTAGLTNADGQIVADGPRATLRVSPANISDAEWADMKRDIGLLALAGSACMQDDLVVPVGEGAGLEDHGKAWSPYRGTMHTARELLDMTTVVKREWAAITRRPLKHIQFGAGEVRLNRGGLAPTQLLAARVTPARAQILGLARQENLQCDENAYLVSLLERLRRLIDGVADAIGLLDLSKPDWPALSDVLSLRQREQLRQAMLIAAASEAQREAAAAELVSLREKLLDAARWLHAARHSEPFATVATPIHLPLPTMRLMATPGYASIFAAFSNLGGRQQVAIQSVFHLYEELSKEGVKPTWNLYELWCVVRVYGALVLDYGFRPPAGADSLFDAIANDGGELKLPRDRPFVLERAFEGGPRVRVTLTYEANLKTATGKDLRPDIRVAVTTDIERDWERVFLLDAKYRNYRAQGPLCFRDDVCIIARDRYKIPLGADACFILHTDTDPDFDYWGAAPFEYLWTERGEPPTEFTPDDRKWPGHAYGGIRLRPGAEAGRQLRRLLRLLLQYHQQELRTSCLRCGLTLQPGRDIQVTRRPLKGRTEEEYARLAVAGELAPGVGYTCICPQCREFWVNQICGPARHYLLKCTDGFHRPAANAGNSWLVVCPVCGCEPNFGRE
jgi:hypothetical protein